MTPLQITISLPPPSLNVYLNMHWRERVKVKRRIRREVWMQLLGVLKMYAGRVQPWTVPVVITGTRWGKKPLDPDNLIGSLKPVIDALVWSAVLVDDTEQHVSIGEIRQRKLPNGEVARLELSIERIPS